MTEGFEPTCNTDGMIQYTYKMPHFIWSVEDNSLIIKNIKGSIMFNDYLEILSITDWNDRWDNPSWRVQYRPKSEQYKNITIVVVYYKENNKLYAMNIFHHINDEKTLVEYKFDTNYGHDIEIDQCLQKYKKKINDQINI